MTDTQQKDTVDRPAGGKGLFMLVDDDGKIPEGAWLEIDAWVHESNSYLIGHAPDEDGHVLSASITNEQIPPSLPVRIQIQKEVSRELVIELLKKAEKWLENDWAFLTDDKAVN